MINYLGGMYLFALYLSPITLGCFWTGKRLGALFFLKRSWFKLPFQVFDKQKWFFFWFRRPNLDELELASKSAQFGLLEYAIATIKGYQNKSCFFNSEEPERLESFIKQLSDLDWSVRFIARHCLMVWGWEAIEKLMNYHDESEIHMSFDDIEAEFKQSIKEWAQSHPTRTRSQTFVKDHDDILKRREYLLRYSKYPMSQKNICDLIESIVSTNEHLYKKK